MVNSHLLIQLTCYFVPRWRKYQNNAISNEGMDLFLL